MTTARSADAVSVNGAASDLRHMRNWRRCHLCGLRKTGPGNRITVPRWRLGIVRSCHKRPVSTQQINAMLDEIENEIFNCEDKEVETTVIGELVMDKLKKLDEVAYVRFASVYREFKDVNTFMEELGKLLKK